MPQLPGLGTCPVTGATWTEGKTSKGPCHLLPLQCPLTHHHLLFAVLWPLPKPFHFFPHTEEGRWEALDGGGRDGADMPADRQARGGRE